MDFGTILQQFGFPVALAAALIYWWRKDYSDLVKRVRQIEESRAVELKAYANSYKDLAERVTEALEQHNRLTRHFLDALGYHHGETPSGSHPKKFGVVVPPGGAGNRQHRTPLPFPGEKAQ